MVLSCGSTSVRLAGLVVAINSVGLSAQPVEALLGGLPPIGHEQPSDATIYLEAVSKPEPDPVLLDAVPLLYHGRVRCSLTPDGFAIWDGSSRIDVHVEERSIRGHIHALSLANAFELGAIALPMAVYLLLRSCGRFHIHAGAVRSPSGTTFVVLGDADAGKSTSTLGLCLAGGSWMSDDALLLGEGKSSLTLTGLPRAFHLTPRTLGFFPNLRPFTRPGRAVGGRKLDLDPFEAFGPPLLCTGPPFCLLVPSVKVDQTSRLAPCTKAEAFCALIASSAWATIEDLPRGEEHLDLLRALTDAADTLHLILGGDMATDSKVLPGLLRRSESW